MTGILLKPNHAEAKSGKITFPFHIQQNKNMPQMASSHKKYIKYCAFCKAFSFVNQSVFFYHSKKSGMIRSLRFFKAEGRNTGFEKTLDALTAYGIPLPEFEADENHDYFITRFFVWEGFYDYQEQEDIVRDNVVENVVENLSGNQSLSIHLFCQEKGDNLRTFYKQSVLTFKLQ